MVQPGAFRTLALTNVVDVPEHPAYNNPSLITYKMRKDFKDSVLTGDVNKATKVIYQLFADGGDESLPLWIPLGKDAFVGLREKMEVLKTGADKVEKYSDDLLYD
jgi:hypothetical protein